MGFIEANKSFYTRYFDFETRSSRSEYWWPKLFRVFVYVMVLLVAIAFAAAQGNFESDEPGTGFVVMMLLMMLFWLINFIPWIAVIVRRFHDQDKSGWMFLLRFIPYVGWLVVFIFMCLEGTRGENRFGYDPLESMYDTFS